MLSRLPVFAQIGAGFLCGVVLMAVVGIVSVLRVEQMRARAAEYEALEGIATLAREVRSNELQAQSGVHAYLASRDAAFLTGVQRAHAAQATALTELDRSDQTKAIAPNRLEQIDLVGSQMEDDIKRVDKILTGIVSDVAAGHQPQAQHGLRAEEPAFAALLRDQSALLRYTAAGADDALSAFDRARRDLMTAMVADTLLAMLVFGLTAWATGRSIARRLREITGALERVAECEMPAMLDAFLRLAHGDLSVAYRPQERALGSTARDEIGALCRSYDAVVNGLDVLSAQFDTMAGTLRATIAGIQGSAQNLAGASGEMAVATTESRVAVTQIHAAVGDVASGASEQATHLRSARAEIEGLADNARSIADGAVRQSEAVASAVEAVSELEQEIAAFAALGDALAAGAAQSRERAAAGMTSVSQTAEAMNKLGDATRTALDAMRTLEERSTLVSEIVSTIDAMADQTNLLALNAAIEAARAGEHGRGFAVVAGEVRKLAEQSSRSTREIGQILVAIRAETVRSAQAIRDAASQTQTGLALSSHATEALHEMSAAIVQTAQAAGEVASRSDSMRTASETLGVGIANVSNVAAINARVADELHARLDAVLNRIMPVAASAQQQARTAAEVSNATASLDKQIATIDTFSQSSRAQSEQLRALIGTFRLDGRAALTAAALAALVIAGTGHASATQQFAKETLLSCESCHTATMGLTTVGKSFRASGFRLRKLTKTGAPASAIRGQFAFTSEPDPSGLPKTILDELDYFVAGNVSNNVSYMTEVYQIDGGRPGLAREAWLQYQTPNQNTSHAFRFTAGLVALPVPLDPESFRETNEHYAVWDQTAGNNPFNFFDPHQAVWASYGNQARGLSFSALGVQAHDPQSGLPSAGLDTMEALNDVAGRAVLEVYRYDGRRPLAPANDTFWRTGYGVSYYAGRFSANAVVQNGYDSNADGAGTAIGSGGGFLQTRYALSSRAFAIARYDGIEDTAGGFSRTFTVGAGTRLANNFKLEIEDVVAHSPQTSNTLNIVFGFGLSNVNGSQAY